ncbi:hypothetical protein GCM10009563_21870 [Subtercola frigoramans]
MPVAAMHMPVVELLEPSSSVPDTPAQREPCSWAQEVPVERPAGLEVPAEQWAARSVREGVAGCRMPRALPARPEYRCLWVCSDRSW